jgi:hypothetical protein
VPEKENRVLVGFKEDDKRSKEIAEKIVKSFELAVEDLVEGSGRGDPREHPDHPANKKSHPSGEWI